MILISHRGNINGPNPEKENQKDYILNALNKGYDVEIDLWKIKSEYFLGHDEPQYQVEKNFLNLIAYKTWFHCKNIEAMIEFKEYNSFGHNTDDFILTGYNYVWAYPGKEKKGCICVMPEWDERPIVDGVIGICSDYIERWK